MFKNIIRKFQKALFNFLESFANEETQKDIQKTEPQIKISNEPSEIDPQSSFTEKNKCPFESQIYGNPQSRTLVWHKDYQPLRKVVIWGWDSENQPGFLILFGRQGFKTSTNSSGSNTLDDNITYTSYAIFRGLNGHLPSFETVKLVDDSPSNSITEIPALYYKKGIKYSHWTWKKDQNFKFEKFYNLPKDEIINLPYTELLNYEQYIAKIQELNISFNGFKIAQNPNEILKIAEIKYINPLISLFSNFNIYTRKKILKDILLQRPTFDTFKRILEIGSSELISGLFLQLAINKDNILISEAKIMIESDITWAKPSFVKGIKRCAKLYINALDPELKKKRIKWLKESIVHMDMHLIKIHGKEIPPDKIITGAAYKKYSEQGFFKDYYEYYDYDKNKSIQRDVETRYQEGPYNDGKKGKIIEIKNTIQEAEIYQIPEIIGKIAYIMDAPRMTFYLRGSGRSKAHKYFQRYLKRIINSLANTDENSFIEVIKVLLTSYEKHDYLCKFAENYQFNEFLRYYLYFDFQEKPPTRGDWRNWSARYTWFSTDHLLQIEGRQEFRKDIWDRHLEDVLYIALHSKIAPIVKACYFILKESPNSDDFINTISYEQLINLSLTQYKPMGEMFFSHLTRRINNLNNFDPDFMILLMNSGDNRLHKIAMDYFNKTSGCFTPEMIAKLLMLKNLNNWLELFQQNLLSLKEVNYALFIENIIKMAPVYSKENIDLTEEIKDLLTTSANEVKYMTEQNKIAVFSSVINLFQGNFKFAEWIYNFLQDLILSLSYEDLKVVLSRIDILQDNIISNHSIKRLFKVLNSLKNECIPQDSDIIDILDYGTSKLINILLRIIDINRAALNSQFATLLIMFESEITTLNNFALNIFDSLKDQQQQKLHLLIVDSPVPRAYKLGLQRLVSIYKDQIPKEFIIRMLEHGSPDVKGYISDKIDHILKDLQNADLYMYYLKTILLLPNKNSSSKTKVLNTIPEFVKMHFDRLPEIEEILLEIGGSNIKLDAERALVTLAKLRKEGELNAS